VVDVPSGEEAIDAVNRVLGIDVVLEEDDRLAGVRLGKPIDDGRRLAADASAA